MLAESPPGADRAARKTSSRGRWAAPDFKAVGPDVWLVVAITAVAALLRFSTISSQSFWIDEATTVHEVGLSFGAMLHEIRINETTPPLYFVVAWLWTKLFGAGETGIRSLSAVAGVITVPVVYLCGRELVSRAVGVVAAALAAVSPFLIWYSQEARSYMLFGLFAGLSFLFCARATRTLARRDLIAWAIASGLAVLTHFFAVFVVAPTALWLLYRLRSRQSVVAAGVVAAVQLAVLPLAIGDTSHPLNWILAFPLSTRLEQIPVTLAASELYKSSALGWAIPGSAILLAVVVALLWFGGSRRERRGAALAGSLAAVVILVPIALALVGHDYVFNRNFMPAWIPLSIVVSCACCAPRVRPVGAGLAVVLIAASVWAGAKVDGSSLYRRPNWRGVAAALGHARYPRAIVAYDGNAAEQPLAVYLPGAGFSYSGVPSNPDPVTISELDIVGNPEQSVPAHLPDGVSRLGSEVVDQYLVERFALSPAWHLAPEAIAARATTLLGPAPPGPSILIQR